MFPSLDSLNLDEVQNWISIVNRLGVVALILGTLFSLFVGLWWNELNNRLETRKALLEEAAEQAEKANAKAEFDGIKKIADEAHRFIPQTSGLLYPETESLYGEEQMSMFLGINFLERINVILGQRGFVAHEFPITIFKQGEHNMLTLDKRDDGIALSAEFYDKDENLVCRIKNNEFERIPNSPYIMELTPKDRPHKLEIYDQKNKCIILIDYLTPRSVHIEGEFYLKHERRITIAPDYLDCGFGEKITENYVFPRYPRPRPQGVENVLHYVPDFKPPLSDSAEQDKCLVMLPLTTDGMVVGSRFMPTIKYANVSLGEIDIIGFKAMAVTIGGSPYPDAAVQEIQRGRQCAVESERLIPQGIGGRWIESALTITKDYLQSLEAEDIESRKNLYVIGAITYTDALAQTTTAWFTYHYLAGEGSFVLVEKYGNTRLTVPSDAIPPLKEPDKPTHSPPPSEEAE